MSKDVSTIYRNLLEINLQVYKDPKIAIAKILKEVTESQIYKKFETLDEYLKFIINLVKDLQEEIERVYPVILLLPVGNLKPFVCVNCTKSEANEKILEYYGYIPESKGTWYIDKDRLNYYINESK